MRDLTASRDVLDRAEVDGAVRALRPDHRALLLAVDGVEPGPSDDASEPLLQRAEAHARQAMVERAVEEPPHAAAWREASGAFGAKPQRTRNSLESLLHQVPIGGEDLDRYAGPPRVVRATGREPLDTTAGGETVVEPPEPGEVVWCDDAGVTCRRWDWRQGERTRLTDGATAALSILDALDPLTDDALAEAAEDLAAQLRRLGPDVLVARRMVGQS